MLSNSSSATRVGLQRTMERAVEGLRILQAERLQRQAEEAQAETLPPLELPTPTVETEPESLSLTPAIIKVDERTQPPLPLVDLPAKPDHDLTQ